MLKIIPGFTLRVFRALTQICPTSSHIELRSAMRILTVVRQVLDAEESVSIQDGSVALDGRKLVMDTMDEYGVEEALRLREGAAAGAEVIALAIGPARSEEALRSALAMGADRAILVEADAPLDVIAVSSVVAQVARSEQIDLIFCGGQQADWDSHALGAATAERLEWPQTTWTSALDLQDGMLIGKHDVDGGSESFTVALPAVVTTQQGLNEPRYPTLPNIMKAKKKELRRVPLKDYGVSAKLKIVGVEVQVKERRRNIIDGKDAGAAAAKLVDLLRHDAGVIG
jgi:electron transfer flavoprotein beta subunit